MCHSSSVLKLPKMQVSSSQDTSGQLYNLDKQGSAVHERAANVRTEFVPDYV